ncbi:hypothetical protein [Helicobacter mustelae]|uniref:Putative membrane protein n=1 Tax=Helicobacter mustelae (strain ATCC 43772 / CCUG 25715 / CIP 103759 / LMG 18044 / NCTC 12198 / R85-136P) TaxID=679897 RepID=D3UGL5_HELM1|nr:hypothetical protein [Helicobacter mustelae]CBG39636.1 Putative membrane protein [Helicobacter mustelae 12198]SQH71147.1 membrane protein [Helicobacter mustelae]
MHSLFTLPILAGVASLPISGRITQIFLLFLIGIFCNLPLFFGWHLSINDILFSFLGPLSFTTLGFCVILLLEKTQNKKHVLISLRGYVFLLIANLVFFLCYLDIIPLPLYYWPPYFALVFVCAFTLVAYFFDRVLALLYLLSLLACAIKLFPSYQILDYFFDPLSLLFAFLKIIFYKKKTKK